MNKSLPDKWVRKAIFEAINNIVVPDVDETQLADEFAFINNNYQKRVLNDDGIISSVSCLEDYIKALIGYNPSLQIPCYDYRVAANGSKKHYTLITTQTNQVDKSNKCEYWWESSVLIDVVTSFNSAGNPGSRLLADSIMDAIRNATNNLTLDPVSGLTILRQTQDFPNDISTVTNNENIYRKLMRIELTIN